MVMRFALTSQGEGIRVDLGTADSVVVPLNESIVSTTATAISGTGRAQSVHVFGQVFGKTFGIRLGENGSTFNESRITIGKTGALFGENSAMYIFGSNNSISNYGEISAFGTGITLFSNNGGIVPDKVLNYGSISGENGVSMIGSSALSVINRGIIAGERAAINGLISDDMVNNRGEIDGDINLDKGNDTVINRGLIDGDIRLANGADIVSNQVGTITGTIEFGAGFDTFMPGASLETADGGTDSDTLDFSKSSGVRIALDDSIEATGWARDDSYTGFENLIGGRKGSDVLIGDDGANTLEGLGGADTLNGQAGEDTLYGGAGKDTLVGGAGNDTLRGGLGNDVITGGRGSDTLYGDEGADRFVFALADMPVISETTGDIIADFKQAENDRIDLSAIDANRALAGNQAFTFIGSAAFHKVAGELRFETSGQVCFVDGDTNGDGIADFSLQLNGGVTSLVAADFML